MLASLTQLFDRGVLALVGVLPLAAVLFVTPSF
jgi:hypothetical protein